MKRVARSFLLVLLYSVFLGACAGSFDVVKMQKPVDLELGEPGSACEKERFYALYPARGFAEDVRTSGAGNVMVRHSLQREEEGYAVYQGDVEDPIALEEVLPRMDQPELMALHSKRVDSVHDRASTASIFGWSAIGGAAGGAGLTIASFTSDEVDTALLVSGLSLLGASLIAYIVSEVIMPSQSEMTFAAMREYLFMDGEDDMTAVTSGVSRLNERERDTCSR